MNQIKQTHAHALRHATLHHRIKHLLLRLLRLPNLPYAQSLLLNSPTPPSSFLLHKLLQAYSLHGPFSRCLSLFSSIRPPTVHSLTFLLSACSSFSRPQTGRALHALLLKSGLPLDPFVATSLLTLYANSGLLSSARQLFDEIPHRDKDIPVFNCMIAAHTRNGDLARAKEIFDAMEVKNVVSWTSMISGYSQNGRHEEAVEVFLRMWDEGRVMPNAVTLASVLPACANIGAMGLGVRIEELARRSGLVRNLWVGNGLVEVYAKCGDIERARRVFEEIGGRRNLCSWNSMIMGLAVHGRWREGLQLFHDMRAGGMKPDDITFVGVLSACTHGGLVDQGRHFFDSMANDFSLVPKLQHYGCMVDLLGRAGLLDDAYDLVRKMPMEPDSVIWGTLLGACSFHKEVRLAEIAAEFLFKLEPWNPGNHVILSNIYAQSGDWDSVATVWKLMKGKQQRKEAGYSFIELGGRMHKFLVEDKSNPVFREIDAILHEISSIMRLCDYVHSLDHRLKSFA